MFCDDMCCKIVSYLNNDYKSMILKYSMVCKQWKRIIEEYTDLSMDMNLQYDMERLNSRYFERVTDLNISNKVCAGEQEQHAEKSIDNNKLLEILSYKRLKYITISDVIFDENTSKILSNSKLTSVALYDVENIDGAELLENKNLTKIYIRSNDIDIETMSESNDLDNIKKFDIHLIENEYDTTHPIPIDIQNCMSKICILIAKKMKNLQHLGIKNAKPNESEFFK